MKYRVKYNSGSGSGYSFSDAFETFEEARRWALKYVAPSWWVITPDY